LHDVTDVEAAMEELDMEEMPKRIGADLSEELLVTADRFLEHREPRVRGAVVDFLGALARRDGVSVFERLRVRVCGCVWLCVSSGCCVAVVWRVTLIDVMYRIAFSRTSRTISSEMNPK
jgi:hypothetical protein